MTSSWSIDPSALESLKTNKFCVSLAMSRNSLSTSLTILIKHIKKETITHTEGHLMITIHNSKSHNTVAINKNGEFSTATKQNIQDFLPLTCTHVHRILVHA